MVSVNFIVLFLNFGYNIFGVLRSLKCGLILIYCWDLVIFGLFLMFVVFLDINLLIKVDLLIFGIFKIILCIWLNFIFLFLDFNIFFFNIFLFLL